MIRALLASLLLCVSLAASPGWLVREGFISPSGEGYDCHSSSLIETDNGRLCAAWKAKKGQSYGAWVSHYDGMSWSEPVQVVHSENVSIWTPVLCNLPSGEMLLFYRIGASPREVISYLKRSSDGGKSWSKEEILPAGIVGPTKCHPLVLFDTIISPSSVEVGALDSKDKGTACWIEISEDAGRSWSKVGPIEIPGQRFGAIEPSLVLDSQGNIRMFCRDRAHRVGQKGWVQTAVSSDSGWHWSALQPLSLPNPDSGLDAAVLAGGEILLAYNHSETKRYPLAFAISADDGATWSPPAIVENNSGEFPSVIRASDGLVHMIYAHAAAPHQAMRIKHVVIDTTTVTTTGASR